MELTQAQQALLLWLVVSMISLMLNAWRGDTSAVLRGGALLVAVGALLGGADGAGLALVWWVTVVLVSSIVTSWR